MDLFTNPKDGIGLFDRADRFENTDDSDSEDTFYDSQEFFDECRHYYDQAETEIEETVKTSSDNTTNKAATDSSSLQPSPAESILSQKKECDSSNESASPQVLDPATPEPSSDNTAKKVAADSSSLQPSPAESILSQRRKLDFSDESASPQALEADITKKKVKFGDTSTLGTINNLQSTSCNLKTVPSSGFFASKALSSFASVSANNNTSFASLLSEKRKHDAITEQDEPSVSRMQKKVKIFEEDIICQTKGVLYVLDANEDWKERGSGKFLLNKHENQSHLVMRSDTVFRTILNVKLFPGMQVFVMQEYFIRFGALETNTNEDGEVETKMMNYALKLRSSSTAQEMCNKINESIPHHFL